MIRSLGYVVAVLTIACAAVLAVSLLPVADPTTGWALCVATGTASAAVALAVLPCPCHRKARS
ncbi:hypothetical protein [Streptomyces sp. NPDC127038]|uniref:hypothetical protein n=1 Tax=Streptomyces sp. NPDC127038 TaxID=3347114 RepID=UPI0036604805